MGIHIYRSKRKCCSIRATEQQLTWEEVETALETASREGIEEIQEQAIREAKVGIIIDMDEKRVILAKKEYEQAARDFYERTSLEEFINIERVQ